MADIHNPATWWSRVKPDPLTDAIWERQIAVEAAYQAGFNAFTGDAEADRSIFNPHDADDQSHLYEAWEQGNDDAARGLPRHYPLPRCSSTKPAD